MVRKNDKVNQDIVVQAQDINDEEVDLVDDQDDEIDHLGDQGLVVDTNQEAEEEVQDNKIYDTKSEIHVSLFLLYITICQVALVIFDSADIHVMKQYVIFMVINSNWVPINSLFGKIRASDINRFDDAYPEFSEDSVKLFELPEGEVECIEREDVFIFLALWNSVNDSTMVEYKD